MAETTAPKKTAATPSTPRGPEKLKIAYTLRDTGAVDFVVFGTDQDRTDFLRAHQNEWWRIDDVAKGEITTVEAKK